MLLFRCMSLQKHYFKCINIVNIFTDDRIDTHKEKRTMNRLIQRILTLNSILLIILIIISFVTETPPIFDYFFFCYSILSAFFFIFSLLLYIFIEHKKARR